VTNRPKEIQDDDIQNYSEDEEDIQTYESDNAPPDWNETSAPWPFTEDDILEDDK
jgi:hypothetical protein